MKCPCCNGTGEIDDEHPKTTAIDVIEYYYRSRAARRWPRVTITQLAEQYGYNRTYLSRVKAEYDASGKWGSKKPKK